MADDTSYDFGSLDPGITDFSNWYTPTDSSSTDWWPQTNLGDTSGQTPFNIDQYLTSIPGLDSLSNYDFGSTDFGGGTGSSLLNSLKGLFTKSDGSIDWSKAGIGGLGALGALGSLVDNKPASSAATYTTTKTLPDWYTQAAQGALAKAGALPTYQSQSTAITPNSYLTGAADAAVSGMGKYGDLLTQATGILGQNAPTTSADPALRKAASVATSNVGAYKPLLGASQTAAQSGGKSVLDYDISKYMNPYWQLALNPQLNMIKQNQALAGNDLSAKMAMNGAFGGSRYAVADALNNQEYNRQLNDAFSTGAKNAFDSATGLATGDRSAQQYLSGALSGLGGQYSSLGAQDVNSLLGAGNALQGVADSNANRQANWMTTQASMLPQIASAGQSINNSQFGNLLSAGGALNTIDTGNMDRSLQNYINGINSPYTALSAMNSTLGAVKPEGTSSSVSTQSASSPSALQSLFGLGSTLWGLSNPKGVTPS